MRQLRVVWASLALVALSLAACSALFTAWTWRQTRDLSQSFKILQDRLEQVCSTVCHTLQPLGISAMLVQSLTTSFGASDVHLFLCFTF